MAFYYFDTTDSTNVRARKFAENDSGFLCGGIKKSDFPNEFDVFHADSQTLGHGRLNRKFYSPGQNGIYISFLFSSEKILCDFDAITPYAAVAVCKTLESFMQATSNCQIKWVNDVFVNEKKVCGILTEAVLNAKNNKIEKIIIGIGINLCGKVPTEIENIATTCQIDSEKRDEVIQDLCKNLFEILQNQDSKKILAEYKNRSILKGKVVTVVPTMDGSQNYQAQVVDINEKFHLVVRPLCKTDEEHSNTIELSTGEVSIRL